MNCLKCGAKLEDNDMFCKNCGEPVTKQNNSGESMYSYDRPASQQMNYNQQQMGGQQYSQQMPNYGQAQKKSGNASDIVKIVAVTAIVITIIIAIGLIVSSAISAFGKKKDEGQGNNTQIENSIVSNEPGNDPQNGNNTQDGNTIGTEGVTPVVNTGGSTYKVNFEGFKLQIPDNLLYQVEAENKAILIQDENSTWLARLEIGNVPYQQLRKNINAISSVLTQSLSSANVVVSPARAETIEGVEYILCDIEASGSKAVIGIASLNSMYSACIELYNVDNTCDTSALRNISSIISTAEYTGESDYLKVNEEIDFKDIGKTLEKVTQED